MVQGPKNRFPGPVEISRICGSISQLPAPSLPEVAVIGRSNVGKSSLINAAVGRKRLMRVSGTPGRTREIFFLSLGDMGYLVDLPGYGYAKVSKSMRAEWRKLVEAYLQRDAMGRSCLLIDIRRDPGEEEQLIVDWMRHYGKPIFSVLTKADKVPRGRWKGRRDAVANALAFGDDESPFPFSARTGEGLQQLRGKILAGMEMTK